MATGNILSIPTEVTAKVRTKSGLLILQTPVTKEEEMQLVGNKDKDQTLEACNDNRFRLLNLPTSKQTAREVNRTEEPNGCPVGPSRTEEPNGCPTGLSRTEEPNGCPVGLSRTEEPDGCPTGPRFKAASQAKTEAPVDNLDLLLSTRAQANKEDNGKTSSKACGGPPLSCRISLLSK